MSMYALAAVLIMWGITMMCPANREQGLEPYKFFALFWFSLACATYFFEG